MKTLAIISQKGGSGKSTIAVHLTAYAHAKKQYPALIDLDPQGSSYKWNSSRIEGHSKSPKLEVVQGTAAKLKDMLELAEQSGIKIAVVDTAPHSDNAAAIAAQLADFVLIPCRPARFDLDAIASTVQIVAAASKSAAVVLNAAPRGKLAEEARAALEQQGIKVLPTVLQQRASFAHAVIDGRAVHEYEPEGKAAQEITMLYSDITKYLNNNVI
jgi:chromosome partitioning protein